MTMKRAWILAPTLLAAFALLPASARAHAGPPFPILVDRPVGPYVASVWTDPDIGTGIFFVVLEPAKGKTLPADTRVRIGVRPVDGRLPEAVYTAEPQPVSYGERHYTEVQFDRGGKWRVRVEIAGPGAGGQLAAEVEPTPDGTIGPISLILYAAPFLAVGFLWLKAALRKRPRPEPG